MHPKLCVVHVQSCLQARSVIECKKYIQKQNIQHFFVHGYHQLSSCEIPVRAANANDARSRIGVCLAVVEVPAGTGCKLNFTRAAVALNFDAVVHRDTGRLVHLDTTIVEQACPIG